MRSCWLEEGGKIWMVQNHLQLTKQWLYSLITLEHFPLILICCNCSRYLAAILLLADVCHFRFEWSANIVTNIWRPGEHLSPLDNGSNAAANVFCNELGYIRGQHVCRTCEFSCKFFVFFTILWIYLWCELGKVKSVESTTVTNLCLIQTG